MEDKQSEYIRRHLITAVQEGVPEDQIRNFISGGYIAQPFQLRFHAICRQADKWDGPRIIAMGGARGPGKSHAVVAQIALDDCQRQPGLKVLFLRKIKKAAAESFSDLMGRVLTHIPHTRSREQVVFPNGSRVLIGGYRDENDIEKYLGIEYDVIVIEEATLLSKLKREKIEGSLRTSLPQWRPRMYLSTNPGGIGHAWFKEEIILPYRENRQTYTAFVPGNYKDNVYLDLGYIEYLERLAGQLGKAWRDGDWDAFEGMAFPLWNDDIHVVERFPIPDNWTKFVGIDWGYSAPWAVVYIAVDPATQKYYVYDELYASHLTTQQQANTLKITGLGDRNYADPALWGTKEMDGKVTTTADEYKKLGVYLEKADNNRINGKRKLDQLLGSQADGEPGIYVMEHCKHWRRTVPSLPLDPIKTEDVDTSAEDHMYDATRYALTRLAYKDAPKQQKEPPLKRLGGLL